MSFFQISNVTNCFCNIINTNKLSKQSQPLLIHFREPSVETKVHVTFYVYNIEKFNYMKPLLKKCRLTYLCGVFFGITNIFIYCS